MHVAGSYSDFQVYDEGRFKFFFFSFGISIFGWRYCRSVIFVEWTFLKNKFKGMFLIVAALDDDNHIFPLGFDIVDSENDSSWLWFFEQLRIVIDSREDLVIISDRNSSIPNAISKVYTWMLTMGFVCSICITT